MMQGVGYGAIWYVNTAPYGNEGMFIYTGSGSAAGGSGDPFNPTPSTLFRAFPQSNDVRFFPNTNRRAFPIT